MGNITVLHKHLSGFNFLFEVVIHFRCNTFTFLTASTLLYKSVRGAFRNVGRK